VRIVVDTNVWISGLLWRGPSWRLLKLAEAGAIEICVAYAMLLELEEVLAYPQFEPRLDELEQTPAQLALFAMSLALAFDVSRPQIPIVIDDPDDDIFLVCASAADAAYVVTADRHLLRLGSFSGIPILNVDEFLRRAHVDENATTQSP